MSKYPLLIFKSLKQNLDVTTKEITKNLLIAPCYPMIIVSPLILSIGDKDYGNTGNPFTSFLLWSFLSIPLFFILIYTIYFIFVYVFAYFSQTFLLKRKQINFFTVMLSAIMITSIYTWIFIREISPAFQLFLFLSCFSMPIAFSYWILTFRMHNKKSRNTNDKFID